MSLTEGIAILGAVTGTTGSVLGAMSYRRDRARTVIRTQAGKAAAYDGFLVEIELFNAGRRPVTIIMVTVLRSRWRRLGSFIRLVRFPRLMTVIRRAGGLESIGDALDEDDEHLVLKPNDSRKYVLRARDFKVRDGRPTRFTHAYVVAAPRRAMTKRVHMDGDAESWEVLP